MSKGINKSNFKFIMDMIYGLAKNKSILITDIARALMEGTKLAYTVNRLCDKLANFDEDEKLYNNYVDEIKNKFADEPIVIFVDSDIAKRYGKKFENLDPVRDTSRINEKIECEIAAMNKINDSLIDTKTNVKENSYDRARTNK